MKRARDGKGTEEKRRKGEWTGEKKGMEFRGLESTPYCMRPQTAVVLAIPAEYVFTSIRHNETSA